MNNLDVIESLFHRSVIKKLIPLYLMEKTTVMSITVVYPPNEVLYNPNTKTLFLAGSIEMGKAIDWQSKLIEELNWELQQDPSFCTDSHSRLMILNPRRHDWDSSWKQTIDNPSFVEQVEWELSGLERADIIILFLAANTNSPISLLELGLHTKSGKLLVYCEEGFSRKGNVDIVCKNYDIKQVFSWDELVQSTKEVIVSADKYMDLYI